LSYRRDQSAIGADCYGCDAIFGTHFVIAQSEKALFVNANASVHQHDSVSGGAGGGGLPCPTACSIL
jgi:hypothetical protein